MNDALGSIALLMVVWISWLPKSLLPYLSTTIHSVLYLLARRECDKAGQNIKRIYGLPLGSYFSKMFIKQWLRHSVICMLETIRGIMRPEDIRIEGFAKLKATTSAAEREGRGVLFVTSHLGSWELCAYFAGRACEKPLHVLAKPPRFAWAKFPLEKFRRKMLVEVIWTDNSSLLKSMLKCLRRGESLGFVMDQKPERRQGPVVEFFSRPTSFVGGPASLAVKCQCPVIGIHVVRIGPFHYQIESELLLAKDHGLENEQQTTQIFASFFEQSIRTYPEQWTWNYRRWKEGVLHS